METRPLPTEIKLHQQSRVLEIAYSDGALFRLPCEYLRVYSPSAAVRGHSPRTARLQVGMEQVGITQIEQVGSYAVKIYFSDGHKTGLYDWQYLYQLGSAWQARWRDYLGRLTAAGHERTGPDPFDELMARGQPPAELPLTSA